MPYFLFVLLCRCCSLTRSCACTQPHHVQQRLSPRVSPGLPALLLLLCWRAVCGWRYARPPPRPPHSLDFATLSVFVCARARACHNVFARNPARTRCAFVVDNTLAYVAAPFEGHACVAIRVCVCAFVCLSIAQHGHGR